jgi:AraC-like DNA-binding protein
MVHYYTVPPAPHLAEYVRFFWVLESDAPTYIHRSMADVCPELVFHYRGQFDQLHGSGEPEKSFLAGIQGPAQEISRFQIKEPFGIFGVYLYPYALAALFGVATPDLTNQNYDLTQLLGQAGGELAERITLADDNRQRIQIITHFIEGKLKAEPNQSPAITAAIRSIIQTGELVRVATLADRCCLSERQFERNFKALAGFGPKLFSRIVRFQAATRAHRISYPSLAQLALTCGYYDQSHFIQDFKEFSGYYPREFFVGQLNETLWRSR